MDTGLDSAPMNLFDAPAGFDDPIGMWLGCHRRIEKQLKTLAKLPAHLADKGIDAEASTAAQSILRYFERSGPHHHEDEEIDVEDARGRLTRYRVREAAVVDRSATRLLDPADSPQLTLITCWPFDAIQSGTPQRYVVIADRV